MHLARRGTNQLPQRVCQQMSVPSSRLSRSVTEHFADHWQGSASGNEQRRKGVPQIVHPNIFQARTGSHLLPVLRKRVRWSILPAQ